MITVQKAPFNKSYDAKMDYEEALSIYTQRGIDYFIRFIGDLFPDRGLDGCSLSWVASSKFSCKLVGRNGDVLLGWK